MCLESEIGAVGDSEVEMDLTQGREFKGEDPRIAKRNLTH